MKKQITTTILAALISTSAFGEFETWTNAAGKSVNMKLVHVDRNGEDTTAKFKLEDGNLATVDPSTLSEEDAKRVLAWKPTPDTEGFFDYMFDGNLVVLDGESFTTHSHDPKPVKYYAFYYTASWMRTMHPLHTYPRRLLQEKQKCKFRNHPRQRRPQRASDVGIRPKSENAMASD